MGVERVRFEIESNSSVMSGGERKKRTSRGQGWEEAGAEFYQESYPADVDLEVLQRDPSHLATLLPSKQSQGGGEPLWYSGQSSWLQSQRSRVKSLALTDFLYIGGSGSRSTQPPTTKRVRGEVKPTLRRRTSTRSRYNSTTRRPSAAHDVHVAMMPDLSENLSNEERTWEEIMQIKAMPVGMTQKKELKAKLQTATKLRLQGYEQFKYQQRKRFQLFKIRWQETYTKLELWRYNLKKIEGNFGTGVVAYFLFIKWLMFLNLAIFMFIFLFVVLPETLLVQSEVVSCDFSNSTDLNDSSISVECCTKTYQDSSTSDSVLLDIVQGKGIVEHTILFYGVYSNKIQVTSAESNLYYNLPLAYIIITVVYFLMSLASIIKSAATGFKERLVEGEGQFYKYCNLVFGGWDFCIHNEKSATIKHKALFNEIKGLLEVERLEEERQNRSREEKTKLIIIRIVINLLVLLVLVGAVAIVPVAYSIAELIPSKGCGPFRGQGSVWELVVNTFMGLPSWIQSILFFFSTAGFAVPAFVVLVLCLYYYYAVSAANKHMVMVLKNQLVLEGHDKQFLLNRLSAFIKQQQEHQKALRPIEMTNLADISSGS
uniref:Transmembrane channel-like protein 7 n=1 Tax=Timema bartmani TaxID=61472 RepID=A0A7R9EXY1_9NEOP|nr:unnamed protein product [Timema bartmani]